MSIAALKIGATDMAIANLFGSNMFNKVILAIDDIFYTKGAVLNDVTITHALTGRMAVVMTGISIVGAYVQGRKEGDFKAWVGRDRDFNGLRA